MQSASVSWKRSTKKKWERTSKEKKFEKQKQTIAVAGGRRAMRLWISSDIWFIYAHAFFFSLHLSSNKHTQSESATELKTKNDRFKLFGRNGITLHLDPETGIEIQISKKTHDMRVYEEKQYKGEFTCSLLFVFCFLFFQLLRSILRIVINIVTRTSSALLTQDQNQIKSYIKADNKQPKQEHKLNAWACIWRKI